MGSEKEYKAVIELGKVSETDDREGRIKSLEVKEIPSFEKVKSAVSSFIGKIKQVPPKFSAVKIEGKRAYILARKGQKLRLKARIVEIKSIEIINYKWPFLELKIITGPGVYIRALARDIGKKLKTGGYLYDLERTRVGSFTKENALLFEKLKQLNLD